MPAITTSSRWMLMTMIRIPTNTSMWIVEEEGVVPPSAEEVPLVAGDYYPNGNGTFEDLYKMLSDAIAAVTLNAFYSFFGGASVAYRAAAIATATHTLTLDFDDPDTVGRNALGLYEALHFDPSVTEVAITEVKVVGDRTPKGTVLGADPLVSYREPEKFVKKNFFTDAGAVQTTFRYGTRNINFSVHTEGRPQAYNNPITLYHDMRDCWIEASKGKEVRLYPSYTSLYAYDETDASKLDGYRTIRFIGSAFAPTQTSQKRLHHILEIEAKEI